MLGRKALTTIGGLIALYLIVAKGSGFGSAIKAGAQGSSQVIKTLQARA